MTATARHLQATPPSATPEEAAAVVAAVARFVRESAPLRAAAAGAPVDGWHAAALLEGVARDPWARAHDPWLSVRDRYSE